MNDSPHATSGKRRHAGEDLPTYDTETLLLHFREAIIVHGSERYRLRITSNGKLILTK